jgi:hypothetical protein
MAKAVSKATKPRRAVKPEALGAGLHGAKIELRSGASFRARTLDGRRFTAVLGDDVEPALAEECLRTGRMVILCETARGPEIVGALQTARSVVRDAHGNVSIAGNQIRLKAEAGVFLETGQALLRLEKSGLVRLEGERMVLDAATLVRILASQVELP